MRELPMLSYGLADTHKPTMQSPLSKHSFVLIQYSVKNLTHMLQNHRGSVEQGKRYFKVRQDKQRKRPDAIF